MHNTTLAEQTNDRVTCPNTTQRRCIRGVQSHRPTPSLTLYLPRLRRRRQKGRVMSNGTMSELAGTPAQSRQPHDQRVSTDHGEGGGSRSE